MCDNASIGKVSTHTLTSDFLNCLYFRILCYARRYKTLIKCHKKCSTGISIYRHVSLSKSINSKPTSDQDHIYNHNNSKENVY
jgi:hypothetical protein